MTLAELVAEVYNRESDLAYPHRVGEESLTQYANDAVLEAAERAGLIEDSGSAFCSIDLVAGTAVYDLDDSIITVKMALLDSTGEPVTQRTDSWMAAMYGPTWRKDNGTPKSFIRSGQTVRFHPNPKETDSVSITVTRRPLASEQMRWTHASTDTPAIPAQYHKDLIYWMLYAYALARDVDRQSLDVGPEHYLALFESRFGPRRTAKFDAFSKAVGVNPMMTPLVAVVR